MAKIQIIPTDTSFLLIMTTEDMQNLVCISSAKRKNLYDVVEACFHAGLVTLTQHTKCHNHERKSHEDTKKTSKKEKGQVKKSGFYPNPAEMY